MNRRTLALWIVVVLVAVAAITLLGGERGASGSALSADPRGWLAARRYLEVRGTGVELGERPLPAAGEAGTVWVLAFPWQRGLDDGELEALTVHLQRGGTVLYAYSRSLDQFQEEEVLDTLGLELRTLVERPALLPWTWWRDERATWRLRLAEDTAAEGTAAELGVPVHHQVPRAPADARILYESEVGVPLVFALRRSRGQVVVLPASLFANAYLLAGGHADLLESLRQRLGDAWRFDEYHHGLVASEITAASGAAGFAWDLFMVHLALFYLLGLLAVVRRFGPAWREPAVRSGTTAAFLRNLGALHRELGHRAAAARLLVERVRQLEPSVPEIAVPADPNDARLVELAREVAGKRRRSLRRGVEP